MVTMDEDYPEEWKAIENKKIPQEEIEKFFIDFIKKILNEIKEGKREDLAMGDPFPLYAFACNKGYKFSKKLEKFLINLGDYKLKMHGEYAMPLNSIEDVESALVDFKD